MDNTILLTRGYVAIVDPEDYERLSQLKWHYVHPGYARNQSTPMHRLITNAPKGMDVDHINGDGLDNRKANLRVCSHSNNCKNTKVSKLNSTGFKGVSLNRGYFMASIRLNNVLINLGRYETKEEAALVYNEAASKHFGEFARLNKLEVSYR